MRQRLLAALGLAGVFLVHLLGRSQAYTAVEGALAGANAVLIAAAIGARLLRGTPRLPVLEWALAQLYLFLVFPIFSDAWERWITPLPVLQEAGALQAALLGVLLCTLCILLAFYGVGLAIPRRELRAERPPACDTVRPALWIVLFVISVTVGFQLFAARSQDHPLFYALFLLCSPLLLILLLSFEQVRNPRSRVVSVLLPVLVVVACAMGLVAGRLHYALLPFVALALTQFGSRRGVRPMQLLGIGVLLATLILVVNPAKKSYRVATGLIPREDISQSAPGVAPWGKALRNTWSRPLEDSPAHLRKLAARLNELSTVADVYHAVPERVRSRRGETWRPLLSNWIPRALWSEKPSIVASLDAFNVEIGYLTPAETRHTSFALPIVADGYLNFGWLGVALAGLISGLYFGLLDRFYDPNDRFRFCFCFLSVVTLRSSEAFVEIFGGVAQTFVAVWIVVRLLELASDQGRLGGWWRGLQPRRA